MPQCIASTTPTILVRMKISIGKWRGLQQCATARGALVTLALDQRGSLRQAMRPDAPASVTPAEMQAFKTEVIGALSPHAPSVLLDPEVGAAQCIASGALAGSRGLVVAVEASGYEGEATARKSRLLNGWSIAKTRRMGASAIKLLIYYHPDAPNAAQVEQFVAEVGAESIAQDIALLVEPLSYSVSSDPAKKTLSSAEKRRVVIESARRLAPPGVDVIKAEFPLDVKQDPDTRIWAEACRELSAACAVPWVLLSAGVNYEVFLSQVVAACEAGASGVAVGRAVWKEAATQTPAERSAFLLGLAGERMRRVTALCDALAKPWTSFYAAPSPDERWFEAY